MKVKTPVREKIEDMIHSRMDEIVGLLKGGMTGEKLADMLIKDSGCELGNMAEILKENIPNYSLLLEQGRNERQRKLEEAVVADFLLDMTYIEIEKKWHVSNRMINSALKKRGIDTKAKSKKSRKSRMESDTKRLQKGVGNIVNDTIEIVELLPRKVVNGVPQAHECIVRCLECEREWIEPAQKAISMGNVWCKHCGKERQGETRADMLFPAIVVECKPRIYCSKEMDCCVINSVCHMCCSECKYFKNSKCSRSHIACQLNNMDCGMSRKRRKAEGGDL